VSVLRVLEPGLRSTIQDAGRLRHLRDAVPPSGPADPFAFEAAQRLVGNSPADAAIEIVGLPFRCVIGAPRVIAVTGRGCSVRTRGVVSGWTAVFARAGEEIEVRGSARYAYLAASGGIALEASLGSRSTYLPAAVGPIPRVLAAEDELPLGAARLSADRAGICLIPREEDGIIRVTRGPHFERVGSGRLTGRYRVSERSDRMGVRLEGPRLASDGAEILSIGVIAGSVQVPHGGDPIVLLADHQTTGGYPVVAVVIRADLGKIAQTQPGEEISFYEVRAEDALAALREERRRLDEIA
jgi:biotin-dependent carboxylase-like uncharacterized protein